MARSDSELWHDILAGSNQAWRELIVRYESLVWTVATRSGLSAADASDCFQQTWVTLFKNRNRLRDPSRLPAWLVTTAKREALRSIRRSSRYAGDPADLNETDSGLLPDEELEEIESQAQLEIALAQLDARCREMIDLFFFAPEEMSYEEIAGKLGLAPNSLGPARRRCLERLRQILVKNGFVGERNHD